MGTDGVGRGEGQEMGTDGVGAGRIDAACSLAETGDTPGAGAGMP